MTTGSISAATDLSTAAGEILPDEERNVDCNVDARCYAPRAGNFQITPRPEIQSARSLRSLLVNTHSQYSGDSQLVYSLSITPAVVLTAILLACALGLLGGIFPAIRSADASGRNSLIALIDQRRERLQGKAFILGARLYDENARVFTAHLKHYWRLWARAKAGS